jgi:hypothetical protein
MKEIFFKEKISYFDLIIIGIMIILINILLDVFASAYKGNGCVYNMPIFLIIWGIIGTTKDYIFEDSTK